MRGVREILDQFGVQIEVDDERQVFLLQNFGQKRRAGFLFHRQHPRLAAAGVDQDPEGQRQIGIRVEILDGLRLAIFQNLEVFFDHVRESACRACPSR